MLVFLANDTDIIIGGSLQNNYPQIILRILCKTYSKMSHTYKHKLLTYKISGKKAWEEIFMALFPAKAF